MKIVNVIPLKKGPLKTDLTYFTTKEVENGDIVAINLRNKKTLGLVISTEDVSNTKINIKGMGFNLKKIIEVKEKSIFLKDYLDSILLASKYFASSKNDAMASLVPSLFREDYDKIADIKIEARKNIRNIKAEKILLQETFENRISIYKTLIRENFALKKSVFIVLPTENDIEVFKETLSKGIEQFIFTISSSLTAKKTIEKVREITTTEHPVLILGTTPFLSIPRPDLGVIILEHESSSGYKMISRPHYDLRIFTEIFASKINAKFILSDTLLRFETIARRDLEGLTPMHPLSFRINFGGEINIENPRPKKDIGVASSNSKLKTIPFSIFGENSINEIKNFISKNERVFVFSMRKGLATQTICIDCNEVVSCDKCLAPLVLYNHKKDERVFVCNRCGEEKSGKTVCTHCKSWNLKPLGIGTDTVYEELNKLFPKIKIFKLDKENVKTKKEAEKIVAEFENSSGSILIGTEMALYYLKTKVPLSIIASFDSFWSIPNFKMSEKIVQLTIHIISKTTKKFIIQTKNNGDAVILSIQTRNLLSFIRSELKDREALSYPPYQRFIKIKHTGNKADTLKAKKVLEDVFSIYKPLIFSGFIAQKRGSYITNALIKINPKEWSLLQINNDLLTKLLSLPASFEIFVDPEDLL